MHNLGRAFVEQKLAVKTFIHKKIIFFFDRKNFESDKSRNNQSAGYFTASASSVFIKPFSAVISEQEGTSPSRRTSQGSDRLNLYNYAKGHYCEFFKSE